jgi:hypothetical protein
MGNALETLRQLRDKRYRFTIWLNEGVGGE